jgi:hypothetical protein
MRKLALDLDTLQVESFETHPADGLHGTVLGRAANGGLEPGVIAPDTQDLKGCLESWNNTCVTAKITECNTCQLTCNSCVVSVCWTCPTCPSGGDVCCA